MEEFGLSLNEKKTAQHNMVFPLNVIFDDFGI